MKGTFSPTTFSSVQFCDTATAYLDVQAPTQCTRRTSFSVPQHRLWYDVMWRHRQHVVSTQVTAPRTIMGKNDTFWMLVGIWFGLYWVSLHCRYRLGQIHWHNVAAVHMLLVAWGRQLWASPDYNFPSGRSLPGYLGAWFGGHTRTHSDTVGN